MSDLAGGVVAFDFPSAALSPNARSLTYHRGARARKRYRADCFALALAAKLPRFADGPLLVRLHFVAPRRGYDEDNLVARMKAGLDGLAEALKLDDRVFRLSYRYHAPRRPGAVLVELGVVGEDLPSAPNNPLDRILPRSPRIRKTRKPEERSDPVIAALPARLRERVLHAILKAQK